ncbi:hypothetical protein [Mesomycoplasma hyopneumoniae]|uniref:hypothetical protein n=1 Tax=Mesomycoplasma hyopneumoniae TaxID=2099 RepID=UPI001F17BA05|nr:hypothetical protein [Mesomycoplasma hyopneumoniae]
MSTNHQNTEYQQPGQKEVDAKIFSADQFRTEQQSWKNNLPDQANFYYEFDLEGLDPGAKYQVIGLLDPQQKIRINVPNENGILLHFFLLQAHKILLHLILTRPFNYQTSLCSPWKFNKVNFWCWKLTKINFWKFKNGNKI